MDGINVCPACGMVVGGQQPQQQYRPAPQQQPQQPQQQYRPVQQPQYQQAQQQQYRPAPQQAPQQQYRPAPQPQQQYQPQPQQQQYQQPQAQPQQYQQSQAQPQQQYNPAPQQGAVETEKKSSGAPKGIGITSIILSIFFPLAAFICSIIGMAKSKKVIASAEAAGDSQLEADAKSAKKLCTIGLILSIVFTIILIVARIIIAYMQVK